MPIARFDVEPDGLKRIRLITSKGEEGRIEPFEFFLKLQPAIKKFQKELDRTLGKEKLGL